MSTVSAVPDDQTYLKPKQSTSSSLKLLVAGAAVLAFVLGAVVATATSAGVAAQPTASLSSKKKDLPAPGWDTCDWIESNSLGGDTEHDLGYAPSPWHCIAMVREQYPDATVANIADSGTGSCWAHCTYALGPVLYPDDYPVDYHFCAYCADDKL